LKASRIWFFVSSSDAFAIDTCREFGLGSYQPNPSAIFAGADRAARRASSQNAKSLRTRSRSVTAMNPLSQFLRKLPGNEILEATR